MNKYLEACLNERKGSNRRTHEIRTASEITPEEQDNFIKLTRAEKRAFERQQAKKNRIKKTKFFSYKEPSS